MIILYADDDSDDQEVFTEIVHTINPTVTILLAPDGMKALEMLYKTEDVPHVIFLDLRMPFLNGYEVLAEIRKEERFKETEVIIYSTVTYEGKYDEYAFLNATYLTKPNTVKEGIESLRRIIQTGNSNVSFS